MTYDQYWYGDVALTDAYIAADRLVTERHNYEAWLQGQYVYQAIGSFAECFMSFGKKGKIKIKPYPKKPYEFSYKKTETEEEREEREAKDVAERKARVRAMLMASVTKGSGEHGGNG